jgi:superfamily II DNA or RNA helicase
LVDIAVMQSLSRQGVVSDLVENYGQIIIDECHHIGATSFDAILRKVRARYVLGLTATPIRRDGQHPVIFMQCGPIRHVVSQSSVKHQKLEVIAKYRDRPIQIIPGEAIQNVFKRLTEDDERTAHIVAEIMEAYKKGRKVLVLTERTDHLQAIHESLGEIPGHLFQLHGRLSRKQRTVILEEMNGLNSEEPRILVATGKLVGEGFDHPPLDTLILTMPISWKGSLQQYAGRLHRQATRKLGVSIIDFVDAGHPALLRMWEKRQRGYRAMGYSLVTNPFW